MAEVGTTSELKEWGETRRSGRRRYVLGMTLRFGLLAVIQCAVHAYRGEAHPVVYVLSCGWLLVGFVLGWRSWQASEKQYAEWLSAEATAEATGVRPGASQQV